MFWYFRLQISLQGFGMSSCHGDRQPESPKTAERGRVVAVILKI